MWISSGGALSAPYFLTSLQLCGGAIFNFGRKDMAATKLIPMHVNKGKTAAVSMKERIDYAQNPEKTNGGELISSYECDPRLAWQEFMLDRGRYLATHRAVPEGDVLAYQIRQSFKPGEISPEEANQVGYELAMRFTKGRHAFTVSNAYRQTSRP